MAQIVFTVFSKLSWMQSDRSILLFSKTGCLDLNCKQHQDSHSAGPCTFLNSADQPSISVLFAFSWHELRARTSIQNGDGSKSRPLFGEWLIYSSWCVHFQEVRNTALQGGHRVFVQQVKLWLRVGQNPRKQRDFSNPGTCQRGHGGFSSWRIFAMASARFLPKVHDALLFEICLFFCAASTKPL